MHARTSFLLCAGLLLCVPAPGPATRPGRLPARRPHACVQRGNGVLAFAACELRAQAAAFRRHPRRVLLFRQHVLHAGARRHASRRADPLRPQPRDDGARAARAIDRARRRHRRRATRPLRTATIGFRRRTCWRSRRSMAGSSRARGFWFERVGLAAGRMRRPISAMRRMRRNCTFPRTARRPRGCWSRSGRSRCSESIPLRSITVRRPTSPCTGSRLRPSVPGLENVTGLESLPPRGAILIALPMKIEGGSGGPTRVVALVPAR